MVLNEIHASVMDEKERVQMGFFLIPALVLSALLVPRVDNVGNPYVRYVAKGTPR
jgi:hypothetical protein